MRIDKGRGDIDLLGEDIEAITGPAPRYKEVASEMAPFRQRTVYEVNADLSFFQLNGDVPLLHSKKTVKGDEERLVALIERVPGVERMIEVRSLVPSPRTCSTSWLVMWTARRNFARAVILDPRGSRVGRAGAAHGDRRAVALGTDRDRTQSVRPAKGPRSPEPANTVMAQPAARNTR